MASPNSSPDTLERDSSPGEHGHLKDEQSPLEDEQKTATEWSGPHDSGNPVNWSTSKKVYHTIVPCAVGFLCPFGSSVYTPGYKQVMLEFGVSREISLLPFVFYFLGLSFGPIIAAPTSEQFGRKIVYLASVPTFSIFTLGAGFSECIGSLTLCRFFAGLFASPGLALGTGSISDIFSAEKRGPPMSLYVFMIQLGPALGPVVGGFVTFDKGWRWTQWVICFGTVFTFAIVCGMSETYKRTILQKRAKKYGIPGPENPGTSFWEGVEIFTTNTITRPLHMLFTEPIVAAFDVYVAFNFGLRDAFFAAFSWVFEHVYDFDTPITGLTYLGQGVGSFFGLLIMLWLYRFYWAPITEHIRKRDPDAKMPPEKRLIAAMLGAPILPISLFWFGWTSRPSIHWISPVAAEALYTCGNLLVFACATLYITDCYGAEYGASAWASNTFLRYLFSFCFPLFAVQIYEGVGVGWATSLLGFCSSGLALIPFLLLKYGVWLRKRSNYGGTAE